MPLFYRYHRPSQTQSVIILGLFPKTVFLAFLAYLCYSVRFRLPKQEIKLIDTSQPLMTFTVRKELKNGNNGQTKHFSASHKEKKEWLNALPLCDVTVNGIEMSFDMLREEVLDNRPIASKVGIVVERFLGKRQRLWDSDSVLRGNCKQAIDSFVTREILSDDSMKHVGWTLGVQNDTDKENGPYTKFHLYGVEN